MAIGSKAGIRLLSNRKVLFAVTDVAISDDELRPKGPILDLPVALNAIVPVYNLSQASKLRLSGSTLAGIFLGKITKWNDPAIANDNPGVALPQTDIKVHHYFPNGSPETRVMADYLSKVSPEFESVLAKSSSDWPLPNYRYKGAEVAEFFRETLGSIGYVPLAMAIARPESRGSSLRYAAVRNSDGEFVTASSASVTEASASAMASLQIHVPDFRISITNAPGRLSYPITSFTWILLYDDPTEKKENEAMGEFVKWVLTDGQKLAAKLGYPTLPSNLVDIELLRLKFGAQ